VNIPKQGIIDPFFILDPNREYFFTGLEEFKDKINAFLPWLESLVQEVTGDPLCKIRVTGMRSPGALGAWGHRFGFE